jgi:hypothetical protein
MGAGLNYSGLPTQGGSATFADVAAALRQPSFAMGADNTTLYFSWLERVNGVYGGLAMEPTESEPEGAFIGFNNDAYPDGWHISNTAGNYPVFTGVAATPGQTYFLVLKAQFLPGNDRLTVYVNPPLDAEPASGTAHTGIDLLQPPSVNFYTRDNPTVDELRIGTTYAAVTTVPEPATCSIAVGAGLLLVAGFARRVRRWTERRAGLGRQDREAHGRLFSGAEPWP